MWHLYLTSFGLGTFKFMFSQAAAAVMGLNFFETLITTTLGAWVSATVFYWMAEYFIVRSIRQRKKKNEKLIAKGLAPIPPKNFTKVNKVIVRIKQRIGFFGVATLTPLFLSVPLGSIIVAKFYGKSKFSFPYILLLTFSYSLLATALVFIFMG